MQFRNLTLWGELNNKQYHSCHCEAWTDKSEGVRREHHQVWESKAATRPPDRNRVAQPSPNWAASILLAGVLPGTLPAQTWHHLTTSGNKALAVSWCGRSLLLVLQRTPKVPPSNNAASLPHLYVELISLPRVKRKYLIVPKLPDTWPSDLAHIILAKVH